MLGEVSKLIDTALVGVNINAESLRHIRWEVMPSIRGMCLPYQGGLLGLKILIMNPIKGLLRDYRV